jgi:hypothetical protein
VVVAKLTNCEKHFPGEGMKMMPHQKKGSEPHGDL